MRLGEDPSPDALGCMDRQPRPLGSFSALLVEASELQIADEGRDLLWVHFDVENLRADQGAEDLDALRPIRQWQFDTKGRWLWPGKQHGVKQDGRVLGGNGMSCAQWNETHGDHGRMDAMACAS